LIFCKRDCSFDFLLLTFVGKMCTIENEYDICQKPQAPVISDSCENKMMRRGVKFMPRPVKWRKVCCLPESSRFGALDSHADSRDFVNMTVDEYETIRLIDLEGFTQEECANKMGVGRTTVQGIYSRARKKIAESLVNGKVLLIEGGEYRLCEGMGTGCGRGCHRHRHRR
jgi:predicted DNA-binding protein (UPF0251 family)